ncbi:hypothetical protein PR048_014918 [Dryococelus australis]|uniref:Neuropeptide-like 4 n=1 Tax=Dryococelus australis TaxID=614101 RepID=A0ABQ9HFH4_9NEOP|nr:hypothetical protein PR048_014918 [Dryococelus australis]
MCAVMVLQALIAVGLAVLACVMAAPPAQDLKGSEAVYYSTYGALPYAGAYRPGYAYPGYSGVYPAAYSGVYPYSAYKYPY